MDILIKNKKEGKNNVLDEGGFKMEFNKIYRWDRSAYMDIH